ncbi:MAG: hypothetical protein KGJ89_03995 [Patescibacteria group bacterium]|nr:hypothetical protein [Patescibacteria group bacterium]MDE2015287.1 hypothetical protein [Patescibacteria group bacterium]MDE2227093.1 hypothetical protein [Patescibacteria group bacterium]
MVEKFPKSAENNMEFRGTVSDNSEKESGVVAADKGIVNKIRNAINSKVMESRKPSPYETTVGIYGGKLDKDKDGRLVYDTRGLWSRIDQLGDRVLRSFDEHHAKNPIKMALRNPKEFLKLLPLIVDSKRYRGTPEQTMDNVKRFGLEEYYGPHEWGIEIKDQEVFKNAIGLQDIFRQDKIDSPVLNGIDRFESTGRAVDYMRELHEKAGGIAEGNAYMFLFTEKEGNKVDKPILMIPTEVYNSKKNISEVEKKATDFLDFLASVGFEEYRRSNDWESVRKVLDLALDHYGDKKIISIVASYVRRGRLTLANDIAFRDGFGFDASEKTAEVGNNAITKKPASTSRTYRLSHQVFSAHNTQRLTADPRITTELRNVVVDRCNNYVRSMSGEEISG